MALCACCRCGWCAVPILFCLAVGAPVIEPEKWSLESELAAARTPGEARSDLAGRTGWYRLANGERRLVTWRASGGLVAIDFEELEQEALDGAEQLLSGARRDPSAPYSVEEISFANGNVELVATLFVPTEHPRHKAVVMIHGSGDSDRDNLWYSYHAHLLATAGLAVLLPDKRGSGMSGGSWKSASFHDLAGDSVAAIEWLRHDLRFDPKRIGLIGMSQGGWIAPLVASQTEVALVINVSGATVTPMEQLRHETRATLRQQGLPESFEPAATAIAVGKKPLWWRKNGDFDPLPYWRDLTAPALVIYGSGDEDDNVPVARSVARLRDGLGDSRDIRVEVFRGAGHSLMNPDTGRILEEYLDLFKSFAVRHLVSHAHSSQEDSDGVRDALR